ncbi:MAG: hypothetical protein WC130_05025 [Kiritimatiellia bacterium]
MGAVPVKINPVGSFINRIVAMLITGISAPLIISFAYTQLPFLQFPIIKQIFESVINNLAGKFSFGVQDGVISIVVDAQVGAELSATVTSLAELQRAQQAGDEDAHKKAIEKGMDSWGDLIHWDGFIPKHK